LNVCLGKAVFCVKCGDVPESQDPFQATACQTQLYWSQKQLRCVELRYMIAANIEAIESISGNDEKTQLPRDLSP